MGLLPGAATLQIGSWQLLTTGGTTPLPVSQLVPGRDAGIVFQEPMSALNPIMKVGTQLQEAILAHQQLTSKEAKQASIGWLAKVHIPEPEKAYSRYPHQLSGGQKQRALIAIAMCNHPALLIADEPTTALDTTVQNEVISLMRTLQQEHQSAMLFITHDLALAAEIADETLVMQHGKAVEYGPTESILENPQHPYTRALLACRPAPAHKGRKLPTVADFMEPGKPEVEPTTLPDAPVSASPLLAVSHLKIGFPQEAGFMGKAANYFKAVDDVSFTINKGEILGLAGESGCGKSTLARAIAGLLPVTEGTILLNDTNIAGLHGREWKQVCTQVQMVFQDPYSSLNPRMAVGDAIKEPLMVHNIVPGEALQKEVLRLLDSVQLPASAASRYPHEFSGGQRQRICIARALALRPQLLICDESVSALDVSVQAQVLNLLKTLQQEFQLAYLFISHDLSVVHYISDRVMVMHAGKIVETGTAEQVLQHPAHPYTQKLVAAMPRML